MNDDAPKPKDAQTEPFQAAGSASPACKPRVFTRYDQMLLKLIHSMMPDCGELSPKSYHELQRYLIATASGEIAEHVMGEAPKLMAIQKELNAAIAYGSSRSADALQSKYRSAKERSYQQRYLTKVRQLGQTILEEQGYTDSNASNLNSLVYSLENLNQGMPDFRAFQMCYMALRDEVHNPQPATLAYDRAHPEEQLLESYRAVVESKDWVEKPAPRPHKARMTETVAPHAGRS